LHCDVYASVEASVNAAQTFAHSGIVTRLSHCGPKSYRMAVHLTGRREGAYQPPPYGVFAPVS
jgi:hypothetical protein